MRGAKQREVLLGREFPITDLAVDSYAVDCDGIEFQFLSALDYKAVREAACIDRDVVAIFNFQVLRFISNGGYTTHAALNSTMQHMESIKKGEASTPPFQSILESNDAH